MKTLITSVIVTSLIFSLNAFAGESRTDPVEIIVDGAEGVARGALYPTRSSDNDVEVIGCGIKRNQSGLIFGFCYAKDADGVDVTCFIEDESVAEAIYAMTAYSFIQFLWDGDTCVRLDITNYSLNLPYVKPKN